jgi:hypothetical protein
MRRVVPLALAALLGSAVPASAQQMQDRWTGALTVYGWLTSLSGNATANQSGQQADFSANVADIVDDLQFGAFGTLEVRRGRLGLLADVVYARLANAQSIPGDLGLRVSGSMSTAIITTAAAWRVYESGSFFADALGGARVFNIDVGVSSGRTNPGPTSRSDNVSATWVDPLVGLRLGVNLTDKLALRAEADIGGFGLGSDLNWNLLGAVTYAVAPGTRLELGYRYLAFDYEARRITTDVRMHGAVLGVTFGF